jgi:DNA-binding Lrp family transcriptional regulator
MVLRILPLLTHEFRGKLALIRTIPHSLRMDLDETDLRLLDAVQKDAQLTSDKLGALLNLSASQVGRRRQRLETSGVIKRYCARLDPQKLGLTVEAFVHVHMATHAADAAQSFARLAATRREIISAWTLTGDADYLLRVYCDDLRGLNILIHEVLLPHPSVARVQSQIVMDHLKDDAPLPT